jgi:SAM-dependent methyltransferase
MNRRRTARRERFLAEMSREAVACYRDPYKEWDDDEREYMPLFLSLVGNGKQILDLAGGYGKALPLLVQNGNSVLLGDLSTESLLGAQESFTSSGAQSIRLDILKELPFADGAFDGVWFSEAFEYVPPDTRARFLQALRWIVKDDGVVFLNGEGLSDELTIPAYLKNYLYWKILKLAPVIWGEYIYKLDLPLYQGWHYHALLLSKRVEKLFRDAGFEIIRSKDFRQREYTAYILKAKPSGGQLLCR